MRVLLRVLSALLGLAVAAAGALLVVEVAWAWARPDDVPLVVPWPRWRDGLSGVDWADDRVRWLAAGLVALGLVLALLALLARRRDVRLADPAPEVTAVTSPRSLARVVGHRVRAADGVAGASVTASARRVRVRATSRMLDEDALRPRLGQLVGEVVGGLPLARRPRISVIVDSPKDRR
ncbi:hypothetical protein LX15_002021 [Streptoalloteichus tenebrarius]|uniref:DUF6286 domain-containing protein n=1 Tax=Streptoalloteichus tenebrarius (strain ATCC 17920 / DSM 40477 / JCM 4838 / CBS 697.72 / NBRC 16177 / NCIMB 11028 / NRRL B-12390 / A12253. 1 / ISP 5477) TaxID=1933 RepID=A0ABT1HS41_STRSD|nr:DUF6286 domain-containing protein [Streptoalloteichus tenebrarius]MCP2258327.1 hypothetical protein [Streptoalloteichus tenebrarius]BFF03493.1 DUF6286 domain-containing protein [Streptoalloteichus tenebrarius]